MLIRNVEIDGDPADVRTVGDRIQQIGLHLDAAPNERIVDGAGGCLLPGLHDHHIHLYALAAARQSIRCGPPEVSNESQLRSVLRGAAGRATDPDAWLRGVGYHESVAGELDAKILDGIVPDRPLRIQHRSGALWMLNKAGLRALGLSDLEDGRLFRQDDWLRERLGPRPRPELCGVGAALARFGVTGVTDATPGNDSPTLAAFSEAVRSGALRQRLRVMGGPDLATSPHREVSVGAVKLVLNEYEPMDFDSLTRRIEAAHDAGRAVAIHCVTRAELALAIGALAACGCSSRDRIEHASIAPPELAERLAELELSVVTQPNFVRERGDAYRKDVDEIDRPWLYRCKGLLDAGVQLGGGTDAPFGDPDPWLAMQAATDRRTTAGERLGEREALSPERALALFTTPADAPGGTPRRIMVGEPADFCLLARGWRQARESLSSSDVIFTCSRGVPTWERERG